MDTSKYIVTELKSNIDEASWTNDEAVQAAGKGPGGRVGAWRPCIVSG
jgi:hypothetical protein